MDECLLCGNIIAIWGNVKWCDSCIDEYLEKFKNTMSVYEFVDMKKAQRQNG